MSQSRRMCGSKVLNTFWMIYWPTDWIDFHKQVNTVLESIRSWPRTSFLPYNPSFGMGFNLLSFAWFYFAQLLFYPVGSWEKFCLHSQDRSPNTRCQSDIRVVSCLGSRTLQREYECAKLSAGPQVAWHFCHHWPGLGTAEYTGWQRQWTEKWWQPKGDQRKPY